MGWPFDSSPPDTLTGVVPSRQVAPALEEVDCTAFFAEHEVLVVHQLRRGKAVVQLDQVEVLRPDPCGVVSLTGCVAGQRVDVRQDLLHPSSGVGGQDGRRT